MTENLELWERFADIDPNFTKAITGKPYKGTSPNPHYVIRCLTEMFGPVGKGFGWEVVAEGFQPLGEEVLHWCRIRFWHGDGPGFESYGQTKALMATRSKGLVADEDAPKKSLTDAITKAAAQIGVASNIFLGRWDDNRYVETVNAEYRQAEKDAKPKPTSADKAKWFLSQIAKARSTPVMTAWFKETEKQNAFNTLTEEDQAHVKAAMEAKSAELGEIMEPV